MSFDSFLGLVDSPAYVVTVAAEGRRAGCLVGFASQCSMSPELFMVWLSQENHTYRLARHADFLAVHLLPQRHDLAERFGARCSAETDKFAGLDWTEGPDGTPLLTDAAACFVGRIVERLDSGADGDHTGFLLAPVRTRLHPDAPAEVLRLSQAADIPAGHPVPG
ncbi:flavin reductase family protein [Streptomyces sp. NPDC091272]|uniref:flavin reductase family protein n=1 Tax=Streptomyces sp. NPDC091272 TaxID=3365981 RepID=UPI0037F353F5